MHGGRLKEYDPGRPLFFLHLPKTGGTSAREIYAVWFKDVLLLHYYNEVASKMPKKYDLARLHAAGKSVAVCGHFNRARGFGVDQYYPDASQFITILRNPLERALSSYFHLRRRKEKFQDKSRIPADDVTEFLLTTKMSIVNQFPPGITLSNYKDFIESLFIEIGLLECLDESLSRIARKLGRVYAPGSVPLLNVASRPATDLPDSLKDEFMNRKQLDYAVYNYISSRYQLPGAAAPRPGG
jgi:hypothetical protein